MPSRSTHPADQPANGVLERMYPLFNHYRPGTWDKRDHLHFWSRWWWQQNQEKLTWDWWRRSRSAQVGLGGGSSSAVTVPDWSPVPRTSAIGFWDDRRSWSASQSPPRSPWRFAGTRYGSPGFPFSVPLCRPYPVQSERLVDSLVKLDQISWIETSTIVDLDSSQVNPVKPNKIR